MSNRPSAFAVTALVLAASAACAPPDPGPLPPHAAVVDIVDGDTIVVRSGARTESVRLIGIDTPEVAHHGESGECFGPEAAQRLAELIPVGSTVRLARDLEARDVYDRLLAYVFTLDGDLVNVRLAAEGYATELAIAPNLSVSDLVAAAIVGAKTNQLGIWHRCAGGQ